MGSAGATGEEDHTENTQKMHIKDKSVKKTNLAPKTPLTCVTYCAGTTAYPMFPPPGAGARTVPGGRLVKLGWIWGRGVAGMMRRCWV